MILDTYSEAKRNGKYCIISIVCNEELSFNQVVDVKVEKW